MLVSGVEVILRGVPAVGHPPALTTHDRFIERFGDDDTGKPEKALDGRTGK